MDGFLVLLAIDLAIVLLFLEPAKKMGRLIRKGVIGTFGRNKSTSDADFEMEQACPAVATPSPQSSECHADTGDDDGATDKESLQRLVASVKRCIDSDEVGMSFGFNGISLTLKTGKEILAPQFGHFEKGTLWGVMGPSGAGKSAYPPFFCFLIDLCPLTYTLKVHSSTLLWERHH